MIKKYNSQRNLIFDIKLTFENKCWWKEGNSGTLFEERSKPVIHILPYESFRFFDINGSSILKIRNSAYKIVSHHMLKG